MLGSKRASNAPSSRCRVPSSQSSSSSSQSSLRSPSSPSSSLQSCQPFSLVPSFSRLPSTSTIVVVFVRVAESLAVFLLDAKVVLCFPRTQNLAPSNNDASEAVDDGEDMMLLTFTLPKFSVTVFLMVSWSLTRISLFFMFK
ncbi:hypothetical protein PIB30_096676 [Stylosanthes scabra]|uniref:Uncharacterized protein n=1 Tax=Stylosanthes scabra TaxID=79078 RepID=A0ABU6VXR6_9FABA|nr:hypothetical protein [Stylosanthes scabra]